MYVQQTVDGLLNPQFGSQVFCRGKVFLAIAEKWPSKMSITEKCPSVMHVSFTTGDQMRDRSLQAVQSFYYCILLERFTVSAFSLQQVSYSGKQSTVHS